MEIICGLCYAEPCWDGRRAARRAERKNSIILAVKNRMRQVRGPDHSATRVMECIFSILLIVHPCAGRL